MPQWLRHNCGRQPFENGKPLRQKASATYIDKRSNRDSARYAIETSSSILSIRPDGVAAAAA
jgi:hypothetical protein